MINVLNVSLRYGSRKLFEDVNIKFTPGNCYGVIGANGAGKSTFLKILSGEVEPNTGEVIIAPNARMSVLRQDHYQYDDFEVLETVIMGNKRLYDIMKEKDALYAKPDFTDEDGIKASDSASHPLSSAKSASSSLALSPSSSLKSSFAYISSFSFIME